MKTEKIAGLLAFLLVSLAFVGFVAASGPYAEARTLKSDCSGQQFEGINKTEEIESGIRFQGVMQTPNPCYRVNVSEVVKNGSTYAINLVGESEGKMCMQCIGSVTYEVTFEAEEPGEIKVLHDGKQVDTVDFSPDDKKKQSSFLGMLVKWLKSLF